MTDIHSIRTQQLPAWYDPIKFLSLVLFTASAAINPFIMFGKTFLHYINRYRVRRRQQRMHDRIKMDMLRIEAPIYDSPNMTEQLVSEEKMSNNKLSSMSRSQSSFETYSNRRISLDRTEILETLKHGKQADQLLVIKPATPATTTTLSNRTEEPMACEPNASTNIIIKHMLQKYTPQIFELEKL